MKKDTRLILALDVLSREKAIDLAKSLEGCIDYVKIGYPLILSAGLDIVGQISSSVSVIADLKIADIPNTNTLISRQVLAAGATGLISHAFTGRDCLKACVDVAREFDTLIFAVTEMSHPGAADFMSPQAEKLAQAAIDTGVDGVVAPATRPDRIRLIRSIIGDRIIISPGVGIQGGSAKEAIQAGADYLIVGRYIIEAQDPVAAAKKILLEIE
ncbi:MAG: orotidine-5'-phosphate decarboxylase [Methanotrichaceae archaeon]